MNWISKVALVLLILNGFQNVILAYLLREIASKMGKKANYFTRMLSDQLFLYQKYKNNYDDKITSNRKLLRYSIVTSILQVIFFILLILSFSL